MSCLLLHGLAGSPFEMQPLAGALEAAGLAVCNELLPGHGGALSAYLESDYGQWRTAALARYRELGRQGPVWLAGYSLGGLLALEICAAAARGELPPPAGLLALAVPLYFRKWHPYFCAAPQFRFLRWRARLRPCVSRPPRSAAAREVAPWQGHETVYYLPHFVELEAAQRRLRPLLGTLRTPLCIVQLRHDVCCHPWNSLYLLRRWGGGEAELHLLRTGSPHGGHLPTTHRECRERVAELAVDFARRCLAPAADEPAGTPGDCAAGN
ncbi:alpha/beta fold hydrolase [uncultured Desulfovibrio sp.]|uniref:alpha/beta hydrolase n=1 Tax=uncultured Desulfovibrio sp. TaxID=167968 RepID=UPI0025F44491|nr:alpha/beta fold hydrolase [uncultured Desulfovibrio sp.]